MFDIAPSEMLVVALVAIIFIGPKDLPRVMRFVGQWVGKGRAMARHFRSAVDEMVREAELAEMEKKWKAENERIMREHADLIGQGGDMAALPSAPAEAHAAPDTASGADGTDSGADNRVDGNGADRGAAAPAAARQG